MIRANPAINATPIRIRSAVATPSLQPSANGVSQPTMSLS